MPVSISDVTNAEVEGRGIFDELMRAGKSHLIAELDASRITNAEYSGMYITLVTSAMQFGIGLATQQGVASRQEELIAEQTRQAIQQTSMIIQQTSNLKHEDDLITAKVSQAAQDLLNSAKEGQLLDKQIAKVTAENLIADKQLEIMAADLLAKAAQTALTQAEVTYSVTKNTIGLRQVDKVDEEILMLTQKRYTEQAQILDTVNGSLVTGVIGKQKALYAKQTDGFDRDAEQKLAKIMFDSWGMRLNSDPATVLPVAFIDAEVNKVMTAARQGINLT